MEFLTEFVNNDGEATGDQIVLPATTTTKELNALINNILGNDDPTPFSFYVEDDKIVGGLSMLAETQSTEKVLKIVYRPEAAFGIRAVSFPSATLSGHAHMILCIAFNNMGTDLATGGGDGTVIFWDVMTQAFRQRVEIADKTWIQCISWHQDGDVVAVAGTDGCVRILVRGEASTFSVARQFKASAAPIFAIAWEPRHLQEADPRLVMSTKRGEIVVCNTRTGNRVVSMSGHTDQIMGLAWGADNVIFSASHDKSVKAWDPKSGGELAVFRARSGAWRTLSLSTDYVLRTGAYETGTLVNTDMVAGALERLKRHREQSKVEMIAVGGEDFTVSLLRFHAGQFTEIARLTGHTKALNHTCFSPNGYWLATASFDKTVKLFDAKTGKFVCTLGKGRGKYTGSHMGPVYRVAWSPDSRKVVSASSDTTLKVWDITLQKLINDLPGHEDEIYGVEWCPTGAPVASGGKDQKVKLWR